MPERVLVVEDEAMVAEAVSEVLADYGYAVEYALSAEGAVAELEQDDGFDLVLMDIWFGPNRMDGPTAARQIVEQYDVPVLFFTGYDDDEVLGRTDDVAAYGIVAKSCENWGLLVRAIRFVISRHCEAVRLLRDSASAKSMVRETNHRVKNSFAVMQGKRI